MGPGCKPAVRRDLRPDPPSDRDPGGPGHWRCCLLLSAAVCGLARGRRHRAPSELRPRWRVAPPAQSVHAPVTGPPYGSRWRVAARGSLVTVSGAGCAAGSAGPAPVGVRTEEDRDGGSPRMVFRAPAAVGLAAAAIALVRDAVAVGAQSAGVIRACVGPASGNLRIVGPDEACRPWGGPADLERPGATRTSGSTRTSGAARPTRVSSGAGAARDRGERRLEQCRVRRARERVRLP
jgi:hypothetical protein